MIKVCINCNAQNLEEAIFCKKCGTKLPTIKEVENALREEQEEADRKWKEEVEKTKQRNEALNKERRNEGSVVAYGENKNNAVATQSTKPKTLSKAQMPPQQASTRRSRPKEVEKKDYSKVIITLLSLLIIGAGGFFGYKYLDEQGITVDTITNKIKEQTDKLTAKPTDNSVNIGRASGTFVDAETGLIWQDNEEAKTVIRDWDEAESYCNNLYLADKDDWRLPLKTELESISDTSNTPAIKDGFMYVSPTHYWGSPIKIGSTFAWHIYFGNGGGSYYETMNNLNSVRCVREE